VVVGIFGAMVLAFCGALLLGAGCMDQEPASSESESSTSTATAEATAVLTEQPAVADSDIGISAVASFVTTCTNAIPGYDPGGSGALISGKASACKRKNGSWNTVPQHWMGWCTGNLVNCNGWIGCDPYCK
jgi:hypothetical protein